MHEHAHARRAVDNLIQGGDLEGLLRLAESFHGHLCPMVALGVKAGQYAMATLRKTHTGMEEVVAIVDCHNCFTDGIQVVTGCTFGNNALIFRDLGKTAVTVAVRESGAAVRLAVRPDYREQLFARYPMVAELFQKVVVARQGTAEEEHRLQHMWAALARRELATPLEEQFQISHLQVKVPAYSRIYDTLLCSRCGEGVMATRVVARNGQTLCLACAGESYYYLTGEGIGCGSI